MNCVTTMPYKPGRAKKYSVIKRITGENEPGFGVYDATFASSASVIAWFFNQTDAQEYADWKTSQPAPRSRH